MRGSSPALLATALLLSLLSCRQEISTRDYAPLTVLAAASLGEVFPRIGVEFQAENADITVTFSFAGTDALAAQIEQGAAADVFAGASTRYADQLADQGLVEPHEVFCTNSLVLVLPASNPAGIESLRDLVRPGLRLVVGAKSVPIGTHTRTVLANLDDLYGDGYSASVLTNVASNEENAESVLTKVRLGEADAGFVYVTDAEAAGDDIQRIELPAQAQATARYPIAVVTAGQNAGFAGAFVDFVLGPEAQELLGEAGFGPPDG